MGLMDKIKGAAGVGVPSLEVEIKQRPSKRGDELIAVLRVLGGKQSARLNYLVADVRWIGKWTVTLSDGRPLQIDGHAIFHRGNVPGSEGITIEAGKVTEFPLTVRIPTDGPVISADLKYDFGVRADIEGTADPTFHAPIDITG
jgi:sporulation-control protein spo0M